MVSRINTSAARRRTSHGNVILESVFTLLPTFAFIFAFTDFGLMMFRWSTLQNSLREATRYAVTFQTQAGQGQDASIESVVQQYSPFDDEKRKALKKEIDKVNEIIARLDKSLSEAFHRSLTAYAEHVKNSEHSILEHFVFPILIRGITE